MPAINLKNLSDGQKKTFLDSFDSVISDCDGVLWHFKTPIPGSKEVMNGLSAVNKKRFFFTNNSTFTRKEYATKFESLGFEATEDQILSTAWLTAQYLKNIKFNKTVYLIGSKAIQEELNSVGIKSFGTGPDNFDPSGKGYFEGTPIIELDPDVGAVVIGHDVYFSYPKLRNGCSYLNNPDCLFIATNKDERFPINDKLSVPGSGAFVAAMETCSERTPQVMGKPSPMAIDSVLIPSGVNPERCLMIGDRCNTDIYFGNQRGMTTLLVETGVHKKEDVQKFETSNLNHLVPTYYTSSIADLLEIMKL